MPTTSPLTGIPLPVSGDTDDVPAVTSSAFAAAEPMWIGRFANSADRTAKLTAAGLGSGVRGMLCWLDTPGRYETYDGTTWSPLVQSTIQTDSLAVFGANWDGVTPKRMVAGRGLATVGASALFTVNWSPAFPNGLLYADVKAFDNTNGLGNVTPISGGHNLNTVMGQAFTPNGTAISSGTTILAAYIVVGW